MQSDEYYENEEFTTATRKLGQKYYTSLEPTFIKIHTELTAKVAQDQTQRIGEGQESTVATEFWTYYRQFSPTHLPEPNSFLGGDKTGVEMKILLLIRQYHAFLLDRVYKPDALSQILVKNLQPAKYTQKRFTKLFIVGDIHGALNDAMKMVQFFVQEIEQGNQQGYDTQIVFLGDYIDRNALDIHTMLYLMTFHLIYEKHVLLLRGNHEEISICANYGFGTNVHKYLSPMIFAEFVAMFKDLPLVVAYESKHGNQLQGILCLHGGIPFNVDRKTGNYEVIDLKTYSFNNRQIWLEDMDPISQQILWNDPMMTFDPDDPTLFYDNRRGMGYVFGKEIFNTFATKNKVDLVFRGHQVVAEGFRKDFEGRFITLVSTMMYANKSIQGKFAEITSENITAVRIHSIADLP